MSIPTDTLHPLSEEQQVQQVLNAKRRNSYMLAMLSFIGIFGFLLLWQIALDFGWISERYARYLSTPLELIALFVTKLHDVTPDDATIQTHIITSLQVVFTGYLLAVVIGNLLGLLMGWYEGFRMFLNPLFELIRPIPPVSWIPVTIIWLGIGLEAKAFIVFASAFVACVINSYTGIRQTSPVLKNVAKTCGASNFVTFVKIGIPSAMPMMFAGARVALGNAWATLVAAEMLASTAGLGYMIMMGRNYTRPDIVMLGMVVIAVIGTILNTLLAMLEKKALRWRG